MNNHETVRFLSWCWWDPETPQTEMAHWWLCMRVCACCLTGHELGVFQQGWELHRCRPSLCGGVHTRWVHPPSGECRNIHHVTLEEAEETKPALLAVRKIIFLSLHPLLKRWRRSRRWRSETPWIAPQTTAHRTTKPTWTSCWSTVRSGWRREPHWCTEANRSTGQVEQEAKWLLHSSSVALVLEYYM